MRCSGGLDLSFSGTGLVVLGEDARILVRETIRTTPKMPHRQRLIIIADRVVSILKILHCGENSLVIAKESPAYAAHFGVHLRGEVDVAVQYAMEKAGLPIPLEVNIKTLKKFVSGRGVGAKGLIQMHVLSKWGEKLVDDNQADAYALARVAGAVAGVFPVTLKHEGECVKTVMLGSGMAAEAKTFKTPKKDARLCACGKKMKTGIEFESGRCAACLRAPQPADGGTPK